MSQKNVEKVQDKTRELIRKAAREHKTRGYHELRRQRLIQAFADLVLEAAYHWSDNPFENGLSTPEINNLDIWFFTELARETI